ncbi:hypothetical protein GobsT_16970 [Gemmata obscuriglobus]|uniref:Uncharacterized protein n=1 Tax=Gemmata obscuriglobus TaxID=114 RepID=A0A2Z3H8K6_9BACT|nr:hypothetical protein [Gemmata obscuriglobus]AWM39916.1 hypothetical protein C1280_24860 [Gemmata obscuriglobus]QEG26949.1 hypothetical protein GobsT_16970 [Gemmata obscuriglobus]VTS03137.1 unnamed protein product [Gemmata obscuriglobus UQM 2246]
MARWAYITAVFVALAAWAGAQGPGAAPAPLSPADQLRLLKANGTLIDNLVDHGVQLSRADTPEDRAQQCHKAARVLASAAQHAADRQEAERVAELTGLFHNVVRDALLPTLADGNRLVTPGSPSERKLLETHAALVQDVRDLKAAIPTTGKVAENDRVRAELKKLNELGEMKLPAGRRPND